MLCACYMSPSADDVIYTLALLSLDLLLSNFPPYTALSLVLQQGTHPAERICCRAEWLAVPMARACQTPPRARLPRGLRRF